MRKRWRAVAWPSHFFLQVALSKHGDGKYKSSTTELGSFFFALCQRYILSVAEVSCGWYGRWPSGASFR